ncbi:hypothetical protein [Actinomadura litoris]|uniref:hypothetical protein n=1 Tax=Actinomadura litoris TaxID=2678616 RepID=UPI001FA6D753|nr:hypothetical protein [Actinomadura litoris]
MRRFSSVLALVSSAAILISALSAAPAYASSVSGTQCAQVVPGRSVALICMSVANGNARGIFYFINPADVTGSSFYVNECANQNCTVIQGSGGEINVPAVAGRTYATCGGVLLRGQPWNTCTQPVAA